jgi:hypothetical protein
MKHFFIKIQEKLKLWWKRNVVDDIPEEYENLF